MSKKYRYFLYGVIILTIVVIVYFLSISNKQESFVTQPYDVELNDYNRRDNKMFDLNFSYTINTRGCQDNDDYLGVIIVTSYFGNVEVRSAMRRAFSGEELKELGLRRVFLLGETKSDKFLTQEALENEAERFGDIVQGNFHEAYRNLTYKHIMGLKWASTFCRNVKFVIKMDDDIVIDVKKVLKLLNNSNIIVDNFLAGHVLKNMQPKRDPANKWYVSFKEYPDNYYPPFLSGWFYFTTPKVAEKLVQISNRNRYFWIDDLYVTGILSRNLNVSFINLHHLFAVHTELLQCCLRDLPNIDCDFIVGPNGGDNNMFYQFNKLSIECQIKNCTQRITPLDKTCVLEKHFINTSNGSAVIEPYKLVG
ncbi:beta-1,3-galactosyltransferase 5 [Onthophagus taurus]|uniref:beta-1,3-galactosyltransferase 5 n=1 Tax=Onthophagus taurus TaxID=166361 RepID=UPI0039BEBA5F